MKRVFLLLAAPFALYSAKALPGQVSGPQNASLETGEPDSFSWDLEPRSQKSLSFSQVKAEMAKEFHITPADGDLKLKWDPKSNCSKCKGNQVGDKKGSKRDGKGDGKIKCRDCKKGSKPNSDHTKCVRSNGCGEDEIQKTGSKKCEKCPKGQTPDDKGTTCEKKKEKGKCPDGQIPDPAEGPQDASTEKLKCIADDDKKCPKGESAESRRTNYKVDDESEYEPSCGKDDDPNHKCKDPNTYDHREIDDDGKIKHTCRSTRKAQKEKKDTYTKYTKTSKEDKKQKEKKKKAKSQRGRAGWCWVALAMVEATSFSAKELQDLTQDELNGMVNIWPDGISDPPGDGSIPDYMVEINPVLHVSIGGVETRGIFGAIGRAIGKILGKGSQASGKSVKSAVDKLKTSAGKASKEAIKKAKKSPAVQKMLKSADYGNCLSTAAAGLAGPKRSKTPGGGFNVTGNVAYLNVDWSRRPDPNFKPLPDGTDGKQITVRMSVDTDESSQMTIPYQTYHDQYVRRHRIPYEGCVTLDSNYNNKVTDVDTQGGCCAFYNGDHCEGDTQMFTMLNRQDGQLDGDDNDAMGSFWCTFDPTCSRAPSDKKS